MAFPPEFLDEIRSRIALADVIGRRVALKKRGRELQGLCPFHNEKTPSFTVSEDKGFYHCFGCGAHGDVIGFLMHGEGLSFPEAVEKLAGEAGLAMPVTSPEERAAARRRADLSEVLERAARWFEIRLRAPEGREALAYLRGRGLEPETVEQFRLGFAPDRRGALARDLAAEGITADLLVEAGLIKPAEGGREARDFFFNRVIFPIADSRGRIIAFGGRALGESPAKYLNSPETSLFQKGRVLFNLSRARRAAQDSGEILVTEGYMDVIALTQAGFPAAVAPLGTAVTEAQIAQLWRVAAEPVVCLDGDAAGRRAAFRLIDRALPGLKPGCSLRFVALPPGEDPDSLLRGRGASAMRALLDHARPLAELLWQRETEGRRLDTPERRAGLRRRLDELVRGIGDPTVRELYAGHLRARFEESYGFARRPPAAGGRFAARPGRRGGPARPAAARDAAPRPLGAERDPASLLRRQEQLLLATLLNHPELVGELIEELAALRLADPGHERLKTALCDQICADPGLDSEQLKCHLSGQGFRPSLDAILERSVYSLGPFARPGASLSDARAGMQHLIAVRHGRQAGAEGEEAARLLAQWMDEENLVRVEGMQGLEGETGAQEAELDWAETIGPEGSQ